MKPPNLLNKRMNSELKTFSQLEARVERLDLFLVRNLPGFSRSRLQALIKDGQVLIDGLVVSKIDRKSVV